MALVGINAINSVNFDPDYWDLEGAPELHLDVACSACSSQTSRPSPCGPTVAP